MIRSGGDEDLKGVPDFDRRFARRLEKPRALLPPCIPRMGGLWADLGCGSGVFTRVVADLLNPDAWLLALDIDVRTLRALQRAASEWPSEVTVGVMGADFRDRLPVQNLDGALMANALHFIPGEQQGPVLRTVLEALKPGGRFVLVEYNADRGTSAVPYPISARSFLRLARDLPLKDVKVATRTPSSYLGEMYASVGIKC